MKYDIIIPTWNSMPEFEKCLESITKYIPKENRGDIIVVDRYSADGTTETAEKYGCKILYDDVSLGSARMKGIKEAKTEWIIFIDSDIELFPSWFTLMMKWKEKLQSSDKKVGWIFGRPIDDHPKLMKLRLYEAVTKKGFPGGFSDGKPNTIEKGQRAFTHNTLCLREPLLHADEKVYNLSSWEDYLLVQTILKDGYSAYEVPVFCWHHISSTVRKLGHYKGGWSRYGAKQLGIDMKPDIWMIKKGIQYALLFCDVWYLSFFLKSFTSSLKEADIKRFKTFNLSRYNRMGFRKGGENPCVE